MLHKIYSVYDDKAEAFLQPFFMPNDAMAIRALQDAVNNPETQFHAHPHDYTLFSLGAFSDTDATFDHPPTATALRKLLELVNSDEAGQMPLFEEKET